MSSEHALYSKTNSVAWITLNRPQVLNALNRELWHAIYENLDKAEKDEQVRAVILTGAGRAFSSGDDISEVSNLKTPEEVRAFFREYASRAIAKILSMPKPIIAAVNGPAYGGGCEIAMLCDLVIASNSATFAVPEALIGAIPPVAAVIAALIIGRLNASMMMLTGQPVSAEDARLMGLVNKVVPPEELRTASEELARSTMRAAPSSIKAIKRLVNTRLSSDELQNSVEQLIKALLSDEGKEGHRAFTEKRLPNWINQ